LIGSIVVIIGLAPLGWACGLYGPRWFSGRLGFVRIVIGFGSVLLMLLGLSLTFG
jgi:hypothetical protein